MDDDQGARSPQTEAYDESWAAAISIPMTMVTGLFVNLLSQEWNAPWPVSMGTLIALGLAQFVLLRRGTRTQSGRVHGVSEPYLVGVALSTIVGYSANWLALRAWEFDGDAPIFGSWIWALVFVSICLIPGLMARAQRPAWMWTTALFAGFCGAQFARLDTYAMLDKLGWWLFAVVIIWLITSRGRISASIRALLASSDRTGVTEVDERTGAEEKGADAAD